MRARYNAAVTFVAESVPCITCGYDLRGLSVYGYCPECGTDVRRSLQGDQLSAAEPAWLRRIVRGQRLVATAMLVALLGVLAAGGFLATFILVVLSRPNLPGIVEDVFTVLIGCALLSVPIGLCIGAAGVFLLTSQEGRESERESPWSDRNVARWSITGSAAASIIVLGLAYMPLPGGMQLMARTASRLLLIVLATIAGVSLLRRLALLVRRVPDEPLAARIDRTWRSIRWALPLAGVVLVMPAFGPPAFGRGMLGAVASCAGFIAVMALVLTAAQLVGIMRECAAHFRSCLTTAEQA
jgi:hypothetical protein